MDKVTAFILGVFLGCLVMVILATAMTYNRPLWEDEKEKIVKVDGDLYKLVPVERKYDVKKDNDSL